MSFLEQIKARISCLQPCEILVTSASGERHKEKISAGGILVTSEAQPHASLGFVVDTKPDLQLAVVLPGLSVGSQDVVQDSDLLARHSVTHILSLGIRPLLQRRAMTYRFVELLDLPETRLCSVLDECFSFIDSGIETGGHVFVHCNAGVSRSPSVVIAYLMKRQGMSLQHAFSHLKEVRPSIQPNPGFIHQLKEYEETIKASNKV